MHEEQLIIHEKEPMRAKLTDIVKEKLGSAAAITRESNFAHARDLLQRADRNWTLVVVSETAPLDAHTRLGKPGNSSPACCFVRELRMDREIPVLGLGRTGSTHLKDLLQNWKHTAHAEQHDFAGIAERVDALVTERPLEPSLELEWELGESSSNFWRVLSHGMNGLDVGPRPFTIETRQMDALLGTSLALMNSKPRDWAKLFDGVSAQIYELLFDARQNRELVNIFFREVAKVGYEKLRISFKLAPRWQQAVVEALRVESDIRRSWMLNSPMVRRFSVTNDPSKGTLNLQPLYSEKKRREEKVNCLIITADAQYGEIEKGDWAGTYPALKKIREEADDIATVLNAAKDREVGIVRSIDLGEHDINIEHRVVEALKENDWHIVHFAGHGVIGSHGMPGLVLNARLGEVMKFETLANAIRGTQFLFVSSCSSADPAFISSAIAFSIPAVIGYRWPVDDNDAAEFAKVFYSALFARGHTYKSLEQALLRARNKALDFNAAGNTWASPVLLTQTPARAAA